MTNRRKGREGPNGGMSGTTIKEYKGDKVKHSTLCNKAKEKRIVQSYTVS
jgi:hypothetical protein